jgi:hypothetical protein
VSLQLRELVGFDDDNDDYDDDESDDESGLSRRPQVTLAAAAKKAPKSKAAAVSSKQARQRDASAPLHADAKAFAEEHEDIARIASACAELQTAERSRLPASRMSAETLAGGVRQLKITGALSLFVVTVTHGPCYPLRELPSVLIECATAPLLAMLQEAAAAAQRVQQTMIVELLQALDDVEQRWKVAQRPPFVEVPFAELCLVDESAPLDFVGSFASTERFEMVPPPSECTGETVVTMGRKVLFIGGLPLNGTWHNLRNVLRIYDLSSHKWTTHTWGYSGATLLNRCGLRVGDKVYVFGCITLNVSTQNRPCVNVLDTRNYSWSTIRGVGPASLSYSTATRVGDDVWLIGGAVTSDRDAAGNPDRRQGDRFVFVFDLKHDSFRMFETQTKGHAQPKHSANLVAARPDRFKSLPAIREHTATRVGRFIFLHGGCVDGTSLSSQSFVIDTVNQSCVEVAVATQPRARAGHAAARISDRLIAFVGGRTFADTLLQDIDLFDLHDKTWSVRKAPLFAGRIAGALVPGGDGSLLCIGGYSQTTERKGSNFVATRVLASAQVLNLGLPRLAPPSQLSAFLLKTLQSGNLSDVTMRNDQHRLHRVLLQARCPHLLELIESKQMRHVDELGDDALHVLFRHLYGGEPVSGKLRGEFASILRLPYLVQDDDAAPTVQASLGALFDDDALRSKHADVTFVAGEETFRVHRLFISRAPHFARALDAGMREAQTGTIRVDDVAPATVRALLRFLYSDELVCDGEHAVEMLALADRCQLDDLKKHAETLIESSYDFGELQNVLELLDVAHRYGTAHLQHVALSMLVHDFDQRTVMAVMAEANVSEAVARMVRTAQW